MKKLTIKDVLDFIGVSPKYEGYKYIVDEANMIVDLLDQNKRIVLIDLFIKIAKKYHTNWLCVERNTRTCVDGTFRNGNFNHINELFESISSYYDDKPSNKLFLITVVNYFNNNK